MSESFICSICGKQHEGLATDWAYKLPDVLWAIPEAEAPHPYALAWWSKLLTIADLLEAQDTSVSAKQISWLDRDLFGGMGSLNDLSFDQATLRSAGSDLNERSQRCRERLFQSFLELSQA